MNRFIVALLAVSPVLGERALNPGLYEDFFSLGAQRVSERKVGSPVQGRQNGSPVWSKAPECFATGTGERYYAQTVVSLLLNPPSPTKFDALSLCSEVLRPTSYIQAVTTLTGDHTLTETSITTTTISKTVTENGAATVTALCATPSPSQVCGLPALGYVENFLNVSYPASKQECHETCLLDPLCKSFQFLLQDNGNLKYLLCNTFKVPVKGYVYEDAKSIATFYDRGCPDFLGSGCKAPLPPTPATTLKSIITPAPSLSNAKALIAKRAYTLPDYIASQDPMMIYYYLPEACSCLVTSAAPMATETQWQLSQTWNYTSITSTKSEIYSFTEHPKWSTVYRTLG